MLTKQSDNEFFLNINSNYSKKSRCGLYGVCIRTPCTSLPVFVSHRENFLHTIIHGFGKPAELLTLLFPVDKEHVVTVNKLNIQEST